MQFVISKFSRISGLVLISLMLMGAGGNKGLNGDAYQELADAGVDKYLGAFTPVISEDVGDGWTKHTFDPDGGNGPICIAGTPYSVFTRPGKAKGKAKGKSSNLLIFQQGGGACWQNFYFCNIFAEAQEQVSPEGIWDFDSKDNPFADHSIVYMPYCDGSTFNGDNDVIDPFFPLGGVRYHRGLRNQSAGMDLARSTFPKAKQITVAGSSAGGVGVAGFAPFLVRFLYGNKVKLTVFNDAGPVTVNLNEAAAVDARANDWQFGQFFPASCTECDDLGQSTAIIQWRLDNDSTIREAFYETDGDSTNRFFINMTQPDFRDLIVTEHGMLNASHPERYKRFIVAGDESHTALQTPLFYTQDANGVLLNQWTKDFLKNKGSWYDIVEDAVP
jgi:hypothetical protein